MKTFFATLIFIFCTISIAHCKFSITKLPAIDLCTSYPSGFTTGNFAINELSKNGVSGFKAGQTNVTLIIGFSNTSFEFNPGIGTVTASGTDITIVSYTITSTSITVTLSTSATNTELNTINFNNVQIKASSAASCYLKRTGGTLRIDNSTSKPASTVSWGDLVAGTPRSYSSSTASQTITSSLFSSSLENQIIGVQVVITGTCSSLSASSFSFNTTGSTSPSVDILNAKLYYTGTTNLFSTGTLFGSVSSPNGSFTVNGSQTLDLGSGTYYFWLTYDIASTATNGNTVDAQFVSSIISGSNYSATSGNPTGSRQISNNVYYSIASGNWSNTTSVWSLTSGGTPCSCAPVSGSGFVNINHTVTVDNNYTVNYVTVQNGGNLANAATKILTVTDNLTTIGDGIVNQSSSWVVKNLISSGTGVNSFSAAIILTGDLNVGNDATFQMSGGALLTVNGNLTVNGTLGLGTSNLTCSNSAGTIINGTGNVTGTGIITFGVNKSIPMGSELTISPVVNIASAIVITNNGIVHIQNDITGGGVNSQWTNAANSSLYIEGVSSALLSIGKLETSANSNNVYYNGSGNQNIKTPITTYYNLNCGSSGSGIKSLQSALTVNGAIQITGNAQLNIAASGNVIHLLGNLINNSSNSAAINPSTSTVYFEGTNNLISGSGVSSFYNVNIISTGFLTGNSSNGKVYVSGNWVNEGDFSHNNSDITFNGTSTISGASSTVFNTLIVNASKTLTLHATETDIDGNLTVYGTINHNNGLLVFTGSNSVQNIDGGSTSISAYNIEVSKVSGSVALGRPFTINNSLTLTNGKVLTDATNILTIVAGASSTAGSLNSFVDGPMDKIGSTAFVFPVGDGSRWARIGIGAPTTATTFRAQYFASAYSNTNSIDLSSNPNLQNVSKLEYWQLDRNAGLGNATVTLFWEDAGFSGIDDCSTNDLRVAHFDGVVLGWQNNNNIVVTSGSCTGATSGSITTSTSVLSFSPFTFGSLSGDANPLPIELISFTSECENGAAQLNWSTASESNNDYFTIERSGNGADWEFVDNVNGAGNSNSVINYLYKVMDQNNEMKYYRLKQTDFNGNYIYSEEISSKNCSLATIDLVVYPNPSSGLINIKAINLTEEISTIDLFNIYGEKIYSESMIGNSSEIDLSHEPKGVYSVRLNSGDGSVYQKVIIQ